MNRSIFPRPARRVRALGLLLACSILACASADADFVISGGVRTLAGNGLVLHLTTTAGCLADDVSFILQSTDTNDCFTPPNVAKCCSQSIKFAASDGISRVTCTCGIIIVGDEPTHTQAVDATQTLSVPGGANSFAFASAVPDISRYSMSVQTQPNGPTQRCTISRASGIVNGSNVSNAIVECNDGIFANSFDPR